jgi:hypothetical protein
MATRVAYRSGRLMPTPIILNERAAARFIGLKVRTLQSYRYRGGGPKFVRISARCVRCRRIDLEDWAEAKLRSSTSDHGSEGAQ